MSQLSSEDVYAYYRETVPSSLALVYSATEKFPLEVLNEVRNAFSHLARASAMDSNDAELQKNLGQAKGHLQRAALDCGKICVLTEIDLMDEDMDALVHNTSCPRTILEGSEKLKEERYRLSALEVDVPNNDIVEGYFSLYQELKAFRVHLRSEFNELIVDAFRTRIEDRVSEAEIRGLRKGAVIKWTTGLIIGAVSSIFGALALKAFDV